MTPAASVQQLQASIGHDRTFGIEHNPENPRGAAIRRRCNSWQGEGNRQQESRCRKNMFSQPALPSPAEYLSKMNEK